jgi:hypothetical protein
MPSMLVLILPLLPGKQEVWRQFCQTLQGSRHHEYDSCLRRRGHHQTGGLALTVCAMRY